MAAPGANELVAPPRHGGDLAHATSVYGVPADGWLDLSTGINAVPYPFAVEGDRITRLPAPSDVAALLDVARAAYGVSTETALIAVPGSEMAIRLLPIVSPTGKVAIVSPTYVSHAAAWRQAGRAVNEVVSIDAVGDAAIVVVASPNNPDGMIVEPDALAASARRLAGRGGLLVVDEAFADLTPEISLARHLGDAPAVVLRSLGKFYGLAGVRLGFVAGPGELIAQLAALFGDWPVSGPAIAAGRSALADTAWQAETRDRLRIDAAQLRSLLESHGFAIAGGTDLFVLINDEEATDIHAALAQRGIWTRTFVERPSWLRIGLPATGAFARLEVALSALRG